LFKNPCAFFPIILSLILFLTYAHTACAQTDSTIVVKGIIDTVPNAQYYISFLKEGTRFEDTIQLDEHGSFRYTVVSKEPLRLLMSIDNDPDSVWYNPKLADNFTMYDFWVEPGRITYLEGKKGKDNETVRNSEIDKIVSSYSEQLNKLKKQRHAATKKNLSQAIDSLERAFIKRNNLSYYSLYLLSFMAKQQKQAYPYIEATLAKFPEKLRNTYLGKEIAQRLLINKALAIGSVMPDFEQADTSSKPVKLSDFRGKYVLVDFWASWCVPCRHDNPRLVKIYKRFSGKGFDILGISLDEKKTDWLQAIHHDRLSWTQVSDLKGFDNAVAKGFFIHAVPTKFLMDPNGVIIARDFNSGQLERKLEEIFSD